MCIKYDRRMGDLNTMGVKWLRRGRRDLRCAPWISTSR